MAIQIILNFILAFIWIFLSGSYTLNNLLLGFILGLGFVYLFSRILLGRFYFIKIYKILKLAVVFFVELLKANIDVLKIVLQPKLKNEPGFFVYHTDLKTDWQIVLLSNLITLTPGTVVLGISDDRRKIYIHSIDFSTKEEEVEGIKSSLERVVREVGED
ncbi:Na+/H+ antiporter subunit E [Staphylococcus haemolyticus]|uniref:Na+/H+ antiporter subunit E n=1 Tax=Staphylococcus haemolyticus TaxID=1283 RepID=UPI00069FD9AF|nr:Na+/H+ antiporter subunit E [Staphylococcus haemolyticus]MBU6948610.1 Na+/H+ antiporter subunit E [Staphylococcus haemolyticus]MBU7211441.1 Na+/H+ antiporter subunit E [Staphylococcus haemolyticus]MCE5021296.1 Na+/H+ antiporter subunit E [Staphylococcus haemolyticus]PTK51985.1 Na+/H+ antiporter subunit E [Staphylococcus haemolyticus]PTK57180.1 Na+/H+ antiporter subunit E [Staphylococcus haemolyticus]